MPDKKNFLEIVIMPLVIAVVGIVGTYLITQQQQNNTEILSQAEAKSSQQRAKADRQIKILEIFSDKITSNNERDRILALRILAELDPDLRAKLASAVSITESPSSEVSKVAKSVAEEAAVSANKPRVFIHIPVEVQRQLALSLVPSLSAAGFVVPGVQRVDEGPKTPQVRYFFTEDEQGAEEVKKAMAALNLDLETIYIKGYEKVVRPKTYEIWFANKMPETISLDPGTNKP